jgi:hypothetical protein
VPSNLSMWNNDDRVMVRAERLVPQWIDELVGDILSIAASDKDVIDWRIHKCRRGECTTNALGKNPKAGSSR